MRRVLFLALGACATSLQAQPQSPGLPQPAAPVFSMGQPAQWQPFASAFGVLGRGDHGGPGALLGVNRPILNPVSGLLSAGAEAYGDRRGPSGDAGVRVIARAPALGLGVGADWNIERSSVATVVTFQSAIRRGGIFGHGSMLRLDWLPAGDRTLDAGVTIPLEQPLAGRTRPRSSSVALPLTVHVVN